MAERKRIGLREVRGLGLGQELWDAAVPGFGARRQRSDAVAYVLLYRNQGGRSRRYTIGRHGAPWTPDTAREEARRLLGQVAGGADPSADKQARRGADTVGELCEMYLADAEAGRLLTKRGTSKAPKTLISDRSRVEVHILPLLGGMKVPAVTRDDVEKFMHDVAEGATVVRPEGERKRSFSHIRGGKGAATRTMHLLGAIFTYAVRRKLRPDNPCQGVILYATGRKERRLSDAEYGQLGTGLTLRVCQGTSESVVTIEGLPRSRCGFVARWHDRRDAHP